MPLNRGLSKFVLRKKQIIIINEIVCRECFLTLQSWGWDKIMQFAGGQQTSTVKYCS